MMPPRRRVLIVSPRFPPINAPDHHRVRTSLPYYSIFGWDATVLALTPETCDGVMDPGLGATIPDDVRVVRVAAISEAATRRFGFGHVDLRALVPILRAGSRILAAGQVDVIYFSTTVFTSFALARYWRKRFHCKVVFDVQDPWYQDDATIYSADTAPGGLWKYRMSQWLNRHLERFSMKAADHIITVSPGYALTLSHRYSWLLPEKFSVIPFGAARRDFELAKGLTAKAAPFQRSGGELHWVYVGRGGPDMVPTLSALFRALARLRESDPVRFNRVRLHFVGTNYSPSDRTFKVVAPEAMRWGVDDLVDENPGRVPYFEALSLLMGSDALLLVGSVSGDYTASKLFNYVLARKPTLAMFNSKSLVSELVRAVPWVKLAGFSDSPEEPGFQAEVGAGLEWLESEPAIEGGVWSEDERFSAESLTEAQCRVFDRVIAT